MKKKTRCRRSPSRTTSPEQLQADIQSQSDRCQLLWQEEVTSGAPRWGVLLGLHLRLSELEYLWDAGQELLS